MIVKLITASGERDITDIVTELRWAGERTHVARRIEFGVLSSAHDSFLPRVEVELGNMVKVFDEGKEIFRGYVFTREKAYNADVMNVVAYDGMIYLLKSRGVYNVKGEVVENFVRKVLTDLDIPVGDLARTGVAFSKVFMGNTYYEMIQTAYTEAYRRLGKVYMPLMMEGKVSVIEKGAKLLDLELTNYDPNTRNGNIMDSKFGESIENMVNRVLIIDKSGKKVGEVKDDSLIGLYGVIQDVYQKEDDKNPRPVAESLLNGVERTASVAGFGVSDCITGYAIKVRDEYTGLVGKFFIEADEHTWSNGVHTMKLTLSFENLMDEQDAGA